jgi:hypothetical protein
MPSAAQMAQAASALQQSGLAPYLLQQQYGAQLAQLQQTALLQSWAAGGHHHHPASAYDAFSAMLTGFQAAAALPRQPAAGLPDAAAAAAFPARAAGMHCCHATPPCSLHLMYGSHSFLLSPALCSSA